MDIGTLLGIAVSILTTLGVGLVGYGKIQQQVADHKAEIAELKVCIKELEERIEKAEDASSQITALATSIEHLGIRFADQIKHLVETSNINNEHVRAQLADIKAEMKHDRANSAMARQATLARG